jgi:ankyrin repeat protein
MSKRSLIDSIEVKKACSEDWDAMTGNERVRFCSHCALEVNNLSALTRKQAMRLVSQSGGRICVRYVKNPTDNSPVFARKVYQITRRASFAAGVLSASLAFSTFASAQEGKPALNKARTEISQTEKDDKDKSETATANISGTITDSLGAVIPEAAVVIRNIKSGWSQTLTADAEGVYKSENVPVGRYKVDATYAGFKVSSLEIEVSGEKENIVNLSLESSADIQMITMGDVAFISYSNRLSSAVLNDELEQVKELIARGENVNGKEKNYSNITPLFLAVENGGAEIAETLLNFGARVNARDDNRQTPLMRLDEDAGAELVNLLIKHGARVNLTDKEGNNALILASRSVKAEVLQILITRSADIDAQNAAGRTALMEAADADALENVRALLEAGADASLKDSDGETAFDLTTDEEIKKLLESYGAGNAGGRFPLIP